MRASRFSLRPTAAFVLTLVCASLAVGPVAAAPGAAAAASPPAGEAPYDADPASSFATALQLWESGDYATALPLFEQAVDSSGSPNARLYVARCLRDLGQLPEAYEQMSQTVRDSMQLAKSEPRYGQTRDTAAAELALLEARVARVVVLLDDALAGATVTVNDQPLAPERLGQPVAVRPGQVTVLARPAKGRTVQHVEDIGAGVLRTITLRSEPGGTEPPPPPPAPPPALPEGGGFGLVRGLGIGVAAVGVAGFVTFAVARVKADSEIATLEDECGAGPCTDPTYADVVDSGKTAETIAGVGLGVGIAGVLAGAAMILFGGPSTDGAEQAWTPTPAGVRVHF